MKKITLHEKVVLGILLGSLLYMIITNPSKTAETLRINAEARADEVNITFDLKPPKNVKEWQIKSVELVGNYNEYQRHWINVAYRISNYDKEFLYMLKGENGLFNHDRQSLVYSNGVREPSYGFCQIHNGYHPHIVNDKRFFTDPEWQLKQCYKLWKGGTVFYGYKHRAKVIKHFKFYD
jgi:hypothetical protein